MKKLDFEKFEDEYKKFEGVEPAVPPEWLNNNVLSETSKNLRKDKVLAIVSLVFVHCIVGALVIAVCPQFEIRYFDNFLGLYSIFMKFGGNVCMFLCGSLFLSASVVMSSLILPEVYKRYLYTIRYYKIVGLAVLSLILFSLFTAVPISLPTLSWLLGAVIFGHLTSRLYFHRFALLQN